MYILIRNILVLSLTVVFAGGINAGTAFAADVIYVNDNASGADNGSSWDDAYTALDVALGSAVSPDDIWVAAGIYRSNSSFASFELVDGVDVYGGFAGDEDPNFDLDDRNFSANKTELSGEKLSGGNSLYVVRGQSMSNAPVLDGFTIYAASWGVRCSIALTIKNCVIFDNALVGIYNSNSGAVVENCTIFDNGNDGITDGGIYGDTSNIQVSNCSISSNKGYGLKLGTASTVVNSIISHNTLGGLTGPGQGMVVTNNLVYDNIGNGIHFTTPDDTDILRNNTIVYNSGVGIKNNNTSGNSPAVSNCIVWGNTIGQMEGNLSAVYSCIQGGSPGTGNIADDPEFVLSDPNDFHLSAGSACVDAGASDPNTYEDGELDIDGEARVYNDRIDIGADEYTCAPLVPNVIGQPEATAIANINAVADISVGTVSYANSDTVDANDVISQSVTGTAPCGTVVDLVVSLGQLFVPDKSTDINGDGIVDYGDFALQAAVWLSTQGQPGWDPNSDINNDDVVNIDDLRKVAFDWLYITGVPDKSTDINGDGIVDYGDFALQAAAWLSIEGQPGWNPNSDINNDDVVNIDDLREVALDWLYITGDLDDDGIINYVDFAMFSSAWDSQDGELNYNPDYDLDGNGFINLDDLLVLVNRWL